MYDIFINQILMNIQSYIPKSILILGIFSYYHTYGDDECMGMSMIQRAAIFRPFNSLKGYQELLQEKEKIIVPERILSEDDLEILNRKIHCVQKGMMITIEYRENNARE